MKFNSLYGFKRGYCVKTLLVAVLLVVAGAAEAKGKGGGTVPVKGHVKQDGTYVPPHYRTGANGTKNDNWSTKGNTNPYTGKEGTKEPDPHQPSGK